MSLFGTRLEGIPNGKTPAEGIPVSLALLRGMIRPCACQFYQMARVTGERRKEGVIGSWKVLPCVSSSFESCGVTLFYYGCPYVQPVSDLCISPLHSGMQGCIKKPSQAGNYCLLVLLVKHLKLSNCLTLQSLVLGLQVSSMPVSIPRVPELVPFSEYHVYEACHPGGSIFTLGLQVVVLHESILCLAPFSGESSLDHVLPSDCLLCSGYVLYLRISEECCRVFPIQNGIHSFQ
jgi:hypothetical protein